VPIVTAHHLEEILMTLGTILLILLVLLLIGALPTWGHSRSWGYAPSGGLGLVLVVVTNQPDVARGALAAADLDAIHGRLRDELPIEHVWVCPHDDVDGCPCRKPRPGMILDAALQLGIDLNRSAAVGDRWRDVEAAHRAGVHSVFVDRGYDEVLTVEPDATFPDLPSAVSHLLTLTGA
jgi:D-glycero-D-manno-heptose 1,7-bisphosphate phosphatase